MKLLPLLSALLTPRSDYRETDGCRMTARRIDGGVLLEFSDGTRIELTADEVSQIAEAAGYTR